MYMHNFNKFKLLSICWYHMLAYMILYVPLYIPLPTYLLPLLWSRYCSPLFHQIHKVWFLVKPLKTSYLSLSYFVTQMNSIPSWTIDCCLQSFGSDDNTNKQLGGNFCRHFLSLAFCLPAVYLPVLEST